jgi:nicotinamide-nucleotide amidase
MQASIITVGDEIVCGHVVDTNSAYIASKLTDSGIMVVGIASVRDDMDAICRALLVAAGQSDIVVVTGGLGTTSDDITKEARA